MELKDLKRVRVVVSVLVFALVTYLFLDLGNAVAPWLSSFVVAFQLLPALTKTLVSLGLWTIGGAAILVITILFGRVYCSSLCPLGTLQDVVIHIAGRVRGRRKFRYSKPEYPLHYGILVITALLFAAGSLFLLNLLEPFSLYGRVLQGIVRPVVVAGNNLIGLLLRGVDVYAVYTIPLHAPAAGVLGSTILLFGAVVYLSYYHGRLFCNSLCPAGALLSLVSRFSFFQIVVDRETCTECGLCEKVCKASCIESTTKRIDYAACVGCFNCLDACPTIGLKFAGLKVAREYNQPPSQETGRRRFLAGSALALAGVIRTGEDSVSVGGPDSASVDPRFAPRQLIPVTPPGSRGVAHFTTRCTACHLCVSVCPTQVLRPAFLDYGAAGLFQPKMDYWTAFCTYECVTCTTACPTGAIMPLTPDEKKRVQMGKAHFVKEDCIVVDKKTDCTACSEHCPTKAVKAVPYEQNLRLPELNNDICIGCGACEKACPTKPRKAIYVEANPVHLQADLPEIKELEEKEEELMEFPF
jgi:ferredoxin